MKENDIIPLGTKTSWGTIQMVGRTGGERYYWMVDKHKCVAMIPGFMVEDELKHKQEKKTNDN